MRLVDCSVLNRIGVFCVIGPTLPVKCPVAGKCNPPLPSSRAMVCSLCIAVLCYLPLCLCQLTWEKLPVRLGNTYPTKRRDAGLGYDSSWNILLLFGGKTANKILNDTWIYNVSSGRWREVFGKRSPAGRFSFVCGVSKGHFYIAMGEGRDSTYYNDVWVFTIRSEVWEPLPLQPKPFYLSESEWSGVSSREFSPEPRYGSAGGIFPGSNHLYVSLGCSKNSFYDTATYDIYKHSWHSEFPCYQCTPYTPTYPHPRCLHSGLMTDMEEMVIFGGCLSVGGSGGPCPAGDSWLFDGKRKTWERIENCFTPSLYSAMALLPISAGERRVVLYGGKEQSTQVVTTEAMKEDEIGILNPGTKKWTKRKTASVQPGELPRKRGSMSLVTGEEGIYMFGGFEIESGSLLNDVWLLRGDSVSADGAAVLECSPGFFSRVMVHGILMAVGWGGLLVWGTVVARYLRHKHVAWLYVHTTFQVVGLICGIAGLIIGVLSVESDHFTFSHGIIGLVATILGILQPFNALIQPSRLTDLVGEKSVLRVAWEWTHHVIGLVALTLGLINITLGIFLALSGFEIWIIWGVYLSALFIMCLLLEIWKRQQHHHRRREERFNTSKVEAVDNTGLDVFLHTQFYPQF